MGACKTWTGYFGVLSLLIFPANNFTQADQPAPLCKQVSNLENPPIGEPCHVYSISQGEQKTQFGKIVKVTADRVLLEPHHERAPLLTKIPYIERRFKNTGETVPTGEECVWIPRASISKIIVHPRPSISIERRPEMTVSEANPKDTLNATRERSPSDFRPAPRRVAMPEYDSELQSLRDAGWSIRPSPKTLCLPTFLQFCTSIDAGRVSELVVSA